MIVEYICQTNNTFFGGVEERPYFIPDSTAKEVQLLSLTGIPTETGFLRNGRGYRYFQPDDNIRILSIGLVLPYSYSISSNPINIIPFWKDSANASGFVEEFTGDASSLGATIPYDGAEFPVDVTVKYKSTKKNVAFGVGINTLAPKISMINAPASLDYTVTHNYLYGWFFWKVIHTLPMVSDPV
jgi:hypothetical protein